MKNYKLKFSKLLNLAKTESEKKPFLSKYLSNICLNSKDLDLSNKISFLTLITFISLEKEKNPNTILHINQKLSKYILTENSIDNFIFIRSLYRTIRILREEYQDYSRSSFYIYKTEQIIPKTKIPDKPLNAFKEERSLVQSNFKEYILKKETFFRELFYNETSQSQKHIDTLFTIQNIVNEIHNKKTSSKVGSIINAKWLFKMEYFINEYLKFFQLNSNYNENSSNGKYKRTATETKFETFISKVFNIKTIINGIKNEGEDFDKIDDDIQNEELYYPGKIDNFPLVKWKDLFPDNKNTENIDNKYILRNDIEINKHYFILPSDKRNLISSIFDETINIKITHDKQSLDLYKILFLFPELKLNKNYESWNKTFYLQMSKNQNIKDLLSKLEFHKGQMLQKTCILTPKQQYNFYSISKKHKEILNDFIFIYHNQNFKQFICAYNSYITTLSNTLDRSNLLKKLSFNPKTEILIIEQYIPPSIPFISFPSSMDICCYCKHNFSSEIVKCSLCSYGQYCSNNCLEKDINGQTEHNILHEEINKYKSETLSTKELFSKSLQSILNKNDIKGLCGLQNLGNTCYMNSALQCLSHTEDLTKYLLCNLHEQEANISSRLGSRGILAKSFYDLICNLWKGKSNSISPDDFKRNLGSSIERFSSFNQQDSHEFLSLFLEYLHEDLNRISNKPYIDLEEQSPNESDEEASNRWWSCHKKREDSIISDLFHGQLKSRIDCPDCGKTSVTYDPFMFLALPMGEQDVETLFTFKYFFFDPDYQLLKCQTYTMPLNNKTTISDMITTIEIKNMVSSKYGYEAVVFKNEDKIFKGILPLHHSVYKYLSKGFEICIYNKEDQHYNNTYVYPAKKTRSLFSLLTKEKELISYPFAIAINGCSSLSGIQKECYNKLKKCMTKEQNETNSEKIKLFVRHSKIFYINDQDNLGSACIYECPFCNKLFDLKDEENIEKERYCVFYSKKIKDKQIATILNEKLLTEVIILCAFAQYKDINKIHEGLNGKLHTFMNEELFTKPKQNKKENNNNLNIDNLLNSYLTKEKLKKENEWYCNKCKLYKEAFKKIDIYYAPNYLIVQFKRFGIYEKSSKKLDTIVEFPVDNFDLSKYVIGPNKDECVYDLYGIVNHFGTIEGGHYIAFCKNGNKWFEFNDSKVSSISKSDIVTKNAYLLFYKKRYVKEKNI